MKKPTAIQILLVDDEPAIAESITAYAKKENMEITYIDNGEAGLQIFRQRKFDLIILDWMLPGISGPEMVKHIREKSNVPILMISARDNESDIVIGLDLGADDYITKPFGPREVMARIKSLLRRTQEKPTESHEIKIGNIKFCPEKGEVYKEKTLINLTPNEFRILKILFDNMGMIVSRSKIMEEALGYHDFLNDRTLDTHIKNLRQKLEDDPKKPKFIVTSREVGFKLIK